MTQHSADTPTAEIMSVEEIRRLITGAGRDPVERDTLCHRVIREDERPHARFCALICRGRAAYFGGMMPPLAWAGDFGFSFACLGFFFSLRRSLFPMLFSVLCFLVSGGTTSQRPAYGFSGPLQRPLGSGCGKSSRQSRPNDAENRDPH